MNFQIFDKPCNQCLFSSDKIVSNERRTQILNECIKDDTHFICHKASMNDDNICCSGFINIYGTDATSFTRLVFWLGLVEQVDLEKYMIGELPN